MIDQLVGWSQHISTIMLISGILHLGLVGVRKSNLPADHAVSKYGDTALSAALFPVGILQLISFVVYLISIFSGVRGPAALPLEYAQYSTIFTVLQGGSMVLGGASGIGQAGRRFPWAVLAGGGVAALGAGSVWTAASPIFDGYIPLALSAGIGMILFLSMFYITLPAQETIKAAGDAFAFSPLTVGNGALMSVLGLVSALGVVVL